MYDNSLTVHAWAAVRDGCEIEHRVHGSDSAHVVCGNGHKRFELEFSADGLREYVRHCSAALAEIDAIYDRENPEDDESKEAAA